MTRADLDRIADACDRAGIATRTNGRALTAAERVDALADRCLAHGAEIHRLRAALYVLPGGALIALGGPTAPVQVPDVQVPDDG